MASESDGASLPPCPAHTREEQEMEDIPSEDSQHLKRKRTEPPDASCDGQLDPDTASNPLLPSYTIASYMLRSSTKTRLFGNPKKVTEALLSSSLSKYILEGETRSLGNGAALIIALYEHNIPKVPELSMPTLTLGEWKVTCRRADKDDNNYQYAKVGPLDEDADLNEIRAVLRTFGGGECTEVSWIPPRQLSRFTTGRWLRLN